MSIRININVEKLRKFKLKPRKLRAQWTVETKEPTLYDAFYNGIEYSEDYSDSYVDRKLPDRQYTSRTLLDIVDHFPNV